MAPNIDDRPYLKPLIREAIAVLRHAVRIIELAEPENPKAATGRKPSTNLPLQK